MKEQHSFCGKAYWTTFTLLLATLSLILLVGGSQAQQSEIGSPDQWAIKLLAGTFTPDPGLDVDTRAKLELRMAEARAQGAGKIHALVQLDHLPTGAQKADLAAKGIELQAYVPNYTWMATIPSDNPEAIIGIPGVRWLGDWSAEDKLHPNIKANLWGGWAIHPSENAVMVVVQLHADVPLERGAGLAAAHGGVALPFIEGLHGMTVWIPKDNLLALAGEEDVLWIEEGAPPLSAANDGVRASMFVDEVQTMPYNLDGSGVRIFVFDTGAVRASHNTFDAGAGSRVTVIDSTAVNDHSTHVAGTAAGDGDDGRAKGVAPAATVLSAGYEQGGGTIPFWDNVGDIEADYATARNTYDADLGTNSLSSNIANNLSYSCDCEGDYGVSSSLLDGIVRGDDAVVGSPVIMTWAIGNERTGGSPMHGKGRCGSNYATTPPPACAKNPIHVGAINSDYDSMTDSSGWGPCDDGRLKPIVTAPGCELGRATGETYIYSSLGTSDNAWGGSGWCGTSTATPASAGVIALMIQEWRAQGYGGAYDRPLPALVKAMLIHTAKDLGQSGPDYVYGYGEVNAQAAIDLIQADGPLGILGDNRPENFGDDVISQGVTNTYSVDVPPDTAELKVSLAWDDYAAAAYAANALVNDLDLKVVAPDSTVYYPWVLNPNAPHQPATTGVNDVDNQEQVVVSNPATGTWTIRVIGEDVPQAPQTYGLVYSTHALTYDAAECADQLINGDFESGTDPWILGGGAQRVLAPELGSWALCLGGAINSEDTVSQTVAVPADVPRAELSFAWYMTTTEEVSHPWDFFYAEVRDASNTVLATFDYRSDGWAQGQWMQSENMDLTPWAGQTVRLIFYASNDYIHPTWFYVDDVSLETCPEPTAVDLDHFEAKPNGPAIHVEWETVTEIDNVGFNLYRGNTFDGEYVKLNDTLIPSQSPPGSPVGAVYVWLDEDVESGATYYYKLEDLDIYGQGTVHGPVWATAAESLIHSIHLPFVVRWLP